MMQELRECMRGKGHAKNRNQAITSRGENSRWPMNRRPRPVVHMDYKRTRNGQY